MLGPSRFTMECVLNYPHICRHVLGDKTLCNTPFMTSDDLNEHMTCYHRNKEASRQLACISFGCPYVCRHVMDDKTLCNTPFRTADNLNEHITCYHTDKTSNVYIDYRNKQASLYPHTMAYVISCTHVCRHVLEDKTQCNAPFKTSDDLNEHTKLYHADKGSESENDVIFMGRTPAVHSVATGTLHQSLVSQYFNRT
jgi:hypothetical protein